MMSINKGKDHEKYWILALVAVALAVYYPTIRFLWGSWISDNEYSLAFLVPFVSGYFAWKKWPLLKKCKSMPSLWGLVLMVLSLMIHVVSTFFGFREVSAMSMISLLIGGCLYFYGSALIKLMKFPIAYMIFLIPIPETLISQITVPLQLFACKSSAVLLDLLGVNVVESGVKLIVDGYELHIAPACSGMSSLVALLGVSAVFVYITKLPASYKWILFAVSIPLAIAANIIRITSIGLIGRQWGWDFAVSFYHDWSSPFLFVLAIGMLFLLSWGFECLNARLVTSKSC